MEIIICNRHYHSPIHIHAGECCKIIYIPSMNVAIGISQCGTFGGKKLFSSREDYILSEGYKLKQGIIPKTEHCEFKDIKKLDVNEDTMKQLIDQYEQFKFWQEKTTEYIEDIFK